MDIKHLRKDYCQSGISKANLNTHPFHQFKIWFEQAQCAKLEEVNAMSIATVSSHGVPTLRTVLLKMFDEKGFVFFTNYHSQKGKDILNNPNVALLFAWLPLERQVRIVGTAEKISTAESLAYFQSRPRGSQMGAWISEQSQVIKSRKILNQRFQDIQLKYSQGDIPLPESWGGYRVVPKQFEFWQGRTNRLHDRFVYNLEKNNWLIDRLAP